MDPDQLAELTAWARRLRTESDVPEARAAARAILMLADEVERLWTSPRDDGPTQPPPAPPAGRALADRIGRRRPATDPDASEDDWTRAASVEGRAASDDGGGWDSAARATVAAPVATVLTEPDGTEELGAAAHPPDEIQEARRRRLDEERRRRRRTRIRLAVLPIAGGALAFAAYAGAARLARPDVDAHGPNGDRVGAAALANLAFWARADDGTLDHLRWRVDGRDVTAQTTRAGDRVVWDPRRLGDGEHTVKVRAPGPIPGADASTSWTFVVDTKAPAVAVRNTGVPKGSPVRIPGRTENGARVTVDGRRLDVEDGRFTVALDRVPARALRVLAVDAAGNETHQSLRIALVPRRPPERIRAVHVTSFAWASPPLRKGVLDLLDAHRINAVELDLKDEAGIVGFDADIPLGRRMGAVQNIYDLRRAVQMLHARGAWVIGRLVAFRDPIHAGAAWRAGRRNEVVQTPGGGPYAGYGGFTNPASEAVRRYNIDIAKAAAAAGVDDILYDYVRRPDGPIDTMRFPGLRGRPESAILTFLAETAQALQSQKVFLGASVFGVAATRPDEVAQNIHRMARYVDYIAPMVYPSHWGPGEYNVPDPNGQPYEIVRRSLIDFKRQTRGTGARVMPWLQDFSLGRTYGPAEVRAQISAARSIGIDEFLLWDPLVTYTTDALDANARRFHITAAARQAPQTAPPSRAAAPPQQRATAVRANELGDVPVLMYHQIRADGGGDFDLTPSEFRGELEHLYRLGYRPVRAIDLITGKLNVPAGKSPVVMTFDDSTKEQLAWDVPGRPKPNTAMGIMLAFAKRHPDFTPAGTFFVNREPFAGVADGDDMLRWLVRQGFEIGDHTDDHIPFNQKDATGVQRALVRGQRIITRAVPGAKVRSMALPLGVMPKPASLALHGRWDGESYRFGGVFLVGADPAPSPFSRAFDPGAIPRIRTSPSWNGGESDYGSAFWLDVLRKNPDRRYVSDGDAKTITFPRRLESRLRPAFRNRARPY